MSPHLILPDTAASNTPLEIPANTTPTGLVRRIICYRPWMTLGASTLAVAHSVGEIMVPVIVQLAIDGPLPEKNLWGLLLLVGLLGLTFLVLSVAYRWGARMGHMALNGAEHELRMKVTRRLTAPGGIGGIHRSSGELLTLASTDTAAVARTKLLAFLPVGELAMVVAGAAILLTVSWPLGLCVIVGAAVTALAADRISSPLADRMQRAQYASGWAASVAADMVAGFRVISGLGAAREAAHRYRSASQQALDSSIRANSVRAFLGFATQGIGGLFVVLTALAALYGASIGNLSIGELVLVVAVSQMLVGPMSVLGRNVGIVWATGLGSARRVLDLLYSPDNVPDPADADQPGAESQNAELGKAVGLELLTDSCSLSVAPGELVVLDLPAQAGREITDLLRRETATGESEDILLDDRSTAHWSSERLRESLLVSSGEDFVFSGTVRENLSDRVLHQGADTTNDRAHHCAASDEHLLRAIRAAGFEDVLESLEDGLDSDVGEAGQRLSGGQRQRLILARALASTSEVLVLDRPTTALDSATEATVAASVTEARSGRTTLVLTSATAWMHLADRTLRPSDIERTR